MDSTRRDSGGTSPDEPGGPVGPQAERGGVQQEAESARPVERRAPEGRRLAPVGPPRQWLDHIRGMAPHLLAPDGALGSGWRSYSARREPQPVETRLISPVEPPAKNESVGSTSAGHQRTEAAASQSASRPKAAVPARAEPHAPAGPRPGDAADRAPSRPIRTRTLAASPRADQRDVAHRAPARPLTNRSKTLAASPRADGSNNSERVPPKRPPSEPPSFPPKRPPSQPPSSARIIPDPNDSPPETASASSSPAAAASPRRHQLARWPMQISRVRDPSVGAREPSMISTPAPRRGTEVARVPRSEAPSLAPTSQDHATTALPWPALLVADDAEPHSWPAIERSHARAERLAREQASR
jgi:hypothetical protein